MDIHVQPRAVEQGIRAVLKEAMFKQLLFVETVKLHITLYSFNPREDKGFGGAIRLKHAPKFSFQVCVLGDEEHCEEAKAIGLSCRTKESILRMSKNKKRLRMFPKKYDAFLASPSLYEEIPAEVQKYLAASRREPVLITHEESMQAKVEEVKHVVFFTPIERSVITATVGNVKMTREKLLENVCTVVESLDAHLNGKWANVQNLHIKSCKGNACQIY
ncbi:hypothetical protein HPB48_016662 [Haemaphysalis longicornis]|uniref:Large ribosomal subunit protein uL1 n=1 Tax=Haemaphysalis longicornis TaxID=44386 RepID=A0A9J6G1J7_HAELO|nr:hypothetical protein HPB48_016662 [Haemaphysalis longicornis]